MRATSLALTVGLALLASGCGRTGQELGPLTPRASPAADLDAGTGAAGEEVNPVQTASARLARTKEDEARKTQGQATLTRPHEDAEYQARLEDVSLPLPKAPPPVLVDAGAASGMPVLVNTVLAEVNGEVITREDILGPLRPQMEQWRKEYSVEAFESRCRQVIGLRLREAISQRLVVQEAKAKLSEDEKKQIDVTLGQMLKDLAAQAGSMLMLEEKLQTEGTSLDKKREQERERLMVQRFLRDRISPSVHVTHSELLDYYGRVRDARYVVQGRAQLALIALRKREFPDEDQALALAQAVHQRAASGEDFARLAQRYSQDPMAPNGGDWGFVTKGSFRVKEVDEVLFALEKGKVGPLIETADAFYVVKALDRQDGRTIPFTEAQDELEDELRDRKYNEIVSGYINDLYRRAYVRIMMENM